MSKKTFGSILPPKPNGMLYVKYIDRYDKLPNGKMKAHYKVESTGSTSARVAQKRLDDLEKIFRAKNEKDRIDQLRKYSEAIQAGIDANKPKTRMDGMFEKYLEVLATTEDTITESSKRVYRGLVRSFTTFMTEKGVLFVEDVTSGLVKEYLKKRKGEIGIERYYQTYDIVHNIYDMFVQAKMLIANPFEGTLQKKKFVRKQKRDILTDDELKEVLSVEKEDRIQFLFICALYTSLRLSDCCLLKWENVKFDQNRLSVIPLKVQKYIEDPIEIEIHPVLLRELEKAASSRKEGSEYVYPENADNYKRSVIDGKVNGIFRKLGLTKKRKTFHSLRHTFITNSCNNGTSIQVVQRIAGHSSVRMSMAYYHENREVISNAVNALPDYTQSRGEQTEVVRLPKSLMDRIRGMSQQGETVADALKRLLPVHVEERTVKPCTEVESQMAEVDAILKNA